MSHCLCALSMLEHTIFIRYSYAVDYITFIKVTISQWYTDQAEDFYTTLTSKASLIFYLFIYLFIFAQSAINLLTETTEASKMSCIFCKLLVGLLCCCCSHMEKTISFKVHQHCKCLITPYSVFIRNLFSFALNT